MIAVRACQLLALIDDATSRIWGRFTQQNTTEENLGTLQGWLRRYGRPVARYTDKYTDKARIFRTTRRSAIGNNCREKKPARSFGERCTNWELNGSRSTVRKRKGVSRGCLKLFRIVW